jgi:hypothetical protein
LVGHHPSAALWSFVVLGAAFGAWDCPAPAKKNINEHAIKKTAR